MTDGEACRRGAEVDSGNGFPPLRDAFGRELEYLRLSVTERCNFRCRYCLPNGCPASATDEAPLTVDEIARLARAFASLGFWKIRLTGGEPTIRRDILEIVARIAATPGIRRVGLTTNGYRLKEIARELAGAGLTCLNVSCDSLDAGRFAELTGVDRLRHILDGVDAAVEAGIPRVKVNAVLLRGTCAELDAFLEWIRERPVSVRFIELMKTGDGSGFFAENHVSGESLVSRLRERGFQELPRARGAGPSVNYGHPAYRGHVGIIAPYGQSFCASCNRLRVSSTGRLKLCLFGDREVALRPFLASDDGVEALAAEIRGVVGSKPESHHLGEGCVGPVRNLAAIGG